MKNLTNILEDLTVENFLSQYRRAQEAERAAKPAQVCATLQVPVARAMAAGAGR